MTEKNNILEHVLQFLTSYDAAVVDRTWSDLSARVRKFWHARIMPNDTSPISDEDCDEVIRILDRNGKGNTKGSEAIAKVMIAQGAWRRMLNELHTNKKLKSLIQSIVDESDADRRANFIDELYRINEGQRNNLTGPSGNAISTILAAWDPANNLSVVSLKDRRSIIDYFHLKSDIDWDNASIGRRLIATNRSILDGFRAFGVNGSARTISRFLYFPPVKALWRGEEAINRPDKSINVVVPSPGESEDLDQSSKEEIRESFQIQALIARIGATLGYTIWLPRNDRGRVLSVWSDGKNQLIDKLPLGYDATTTRTVEQIDVLWMQKRSIVRAFEVEHTTSIYSGLLRMADLVALQPNINVKLHIVAPIEKREKVLQEIRRPVFSLLEGRALAEMCSYLSYESITAIADLKHLGRLKDSIIEDYEESGAESGDA